MNKSFFIKSIPMGLIVQKYGGTSVADSKRIMNVARRIAATRMDGNQVIAVVSAMGDTTDDLIKLAHEITPKPNPREMDVLLSTGEIVSSTLLAMALKTLGFEAISLTGAQAGIKTTRQYSRALITDINPDRIYDELREGKIIIVAGFQGVTEGFDVTTLGRGGSDTTAVALAAKLGADKCVRYTDTEGIFTADPRIVPDATCLKEISYEEMLELSVYGSKVVHPRAIELAEYYNMPLIVASSFTNSPGTIIHGGKMEVRNKVTAISHDMNVAKITVQGIKDEPGIAAKLFVPLADAGISVDTIVQNSSINEMTDLTFTVAEDDIERATAIVKTVASQMNAKVVTDTHIGKVSIIGGSMLNGTGYASTLFKTLSEENINIDLITTSEIRITVIVKEDKVLDAVRVLHSAFKLNEE